MVVAEGMTTTDTAAAQVPATDTTTPAADTQVNGSAKVDETTSTEPEYTIKYRGQDEKLPVSKLISFAQQGRDYAERMGKFNADVEAKAQLLAEAAIAEMRTPAVDPAKAAIPAATAPVVPDEELDEFTKLQMKVDAIETERQNAVFEQKVEGSLKELNSNLDKAREQYPFMDDLRILAILQRNPKADIMELAKYDHNQEKERRDAYEAEFLDKANKRSKRGAEGPGGAVPAMEAKKVSWNDTQRAAAEFLNKQN